MTGVNEAWVTFVKDELDCRKALVLAESAKRVSTTRKLVVLVGRDVVSKSRNQLEAVYDAVVAVDKGFNTWPAVSLDASARIFALSLTLIKKLIFLDVNSVFLRRCDEAFDGQGSTKTGLPSSFLAPCLIIPSLSTLETVITDLDFASLATDWKMGAAVDNFFHGSIHFSRLGGNYDYVIDLQKDTLNHERNTPEVQIVRFCGIHPLETVSLNDAGLETDDLVPQALLGYCKSICETVNRRCQEVPILTPPTSVLQCGSEPLAIIGMACRAPGSNNIEEFWDLIINKRDAMVPIPTGRWTQDRIGSLKLRSDKIQGGFLKCPVDEFDGNFFGMSPMELSYTDPQQRFLLEVCWEALEDAGINPLSLRESSTGLYSGSWATDYRDLLASVGMGRNETFRTYTGNAFGTCTGRIAHFLGTTGTAITTESGCSSSMVAVGMACQALRRGDADLVIAAGVNLLLWPYIYDDMESVFSPAGRSMTFDADTLGYGRAEGCGVLIMKRLSDALRDHDTIHAVVRGYGQTQEGCSKSIGTPSVQGESLAMNLALKDAGVDPLDVSFVEAHGTGTIVGDLVEITAISYVYSGKRERPLVIGSVKGNIGHTESCSGIMGILKTVLALKNEIIPSQVNLNNLSPQIKAAKGPAVIPLENVQWPKIDGKRRLAGVSSHGLTGTDTHIILEEAPPSLPHFSNGNPLPLYVVTVSGKAEQAIEDWASAMAETVEKRSLPLADVAFTANTGRAHFRSHRAALICTDSHDLVEQLQSGSFRRSHIRGTKPKLCFLFTGQGGQTPMMGKDLYAVSPDFRRAFDSCDLYLVKTYNLHVKDVLWSEERQAELKLNVYSQITLFCLEYSVNEMWKAWGIHPDIVLGHSVGEYNAAVSAGILSFQNAIDLLVARCAGMDTIPPGRMVVINKNRSATDLLYQKAKKEKDFWLDYAALNSPDQTVLGGSPDSVAFFADFCKNNQVKVHLLDTAYAFHSRHMDPLVEATKSVPHSSPTCIYISGMDGTIPEVNSAYWGKMLRQPVNFLKASETAYELGGRVFLEMGPRPALSAMLMRTAENFRNPELIRCFPSMNKTEQEWTTVMNTLACLYTSGIDVDWNGFHKLTGGGKVTLPSYPFQREVHWFKNPIVEQGMARPTGKQLHPILGSSLENPSSSKLFQNFLELSNLEYLKDHLLGDTVIFPAAAYLETFLSAGYASSLESVEEYSAPASPMIVEQVWFEAPLGMAQGSDVQTVVTPCEEEPGRSQISIHKLKVSPSNGRKWVRHSFAKFSHIVSELKTDTEGLDKLQARITSPFNIEAFYEMMYGFGWAFGPQFRSLKKVWKNSNLEGLAEVHIPEGHQAYFCHPLILDAMLQLFVLFENPEGLFLPVFLESFTWLAKPTSSINYIHSIKGTTNQRVTLYDANGQKLGIMVGAQIVKATLDSLLQSMRTEQLPMPPIFEEQWKPDQETSTIVTDDLNILSSLKNGDFSIKKFENRLNTTNKLSEINLGITLTIIKTLKELGLKAKVGDTLPLDKILGVKPGKILFFRRCLDILCEDGYLTKVSPSPGQQHSWKVIKALPSDEEISIGITRSFAYSDDGKVERDLVTACLPKLPGVLLETDSVLPILFPADPNTKTSAATFYTDSLRLIDCNVVLENSIEYLCQNEFKSLSAQGKKLRILEIGAGTGGSTIRILSLLEKYGIKYAYTYSDISGAFFVQAENTFHAYLSKMDFQVLNIENEPLSQGFCPASYDIIMSAHCLHATKDMEETVRNARLLLRPQGVMMVLEMFKPDRIIDATFGLVDGYWIFKDFGLRPDHCLMDKERWSDLFLRTGFRSTWSLAVGGEENSRGVIMAEADTPNFQYTLPASTADKAWIVFTDRVETDLINKIKSTGRTVVEATSGEKFTWSKETAKAALRPDAISDFKELLGSLRSGGSVIEGIIYLWGLEKGVLEHDATTRGFLSLIQALMSQGFPSFPKVFVVATGATVINDHRPVPPSSGALIGFSKTVQNENSEIVCRIVELDPDDRPDIKTESIFSEIWKTDEENHVFYQSGVRHLVRLSSVEPTATALKLPTSPRYTTVLPISKAIGDLRYGPALKQDLSRGEIEVEVRSGGLNFQDLMIILQPTEAFHKLTGIGRDFSGVVSAIGPEVTRYKVGDAVFGQKNENGAFASHIKTHQDVCIPLPSDWTFSEGVTLPTTYITVYHSLVTVGRLQKGETILIHTASGGVGLVAIQFANYVGAHIIATAGSKRKRAFLRSLGLKHVFHSRDLSFGPEIANATGGKGVDVVLNSITGKGFKETSLDNCSPNARFVEMSKLNIWTKEEVQALRPDVEYTVVDVNYNTIAETKLILESLHDLLLKGIIKPIPYSRFDGTDIREAVTYLQKAKHIGKVVINMPKLTYSNELLTSSTNYLFNDRSTYLITGGLGGIGLLLAEWMITQGAKYLVLCGRSKPNEKTLSQLEQMQSTGAQIVVKQADVGSYADCKSMINSLSNHNLPPLRGVHHAAVVLADAILPEQTWGNFESALNAKANAAWNLHRLTLDLRMEHFVMHSSVATILGTKGQSNYNAASSLLDSLGNYRYLCGLPNTIVNWGQWGQVGLAKDLDIFGFSPFTAQQGFSALEWVMKSQRIQSIVVKGDPGLWPIAFPSAKNYLERVRPITQQIKSDKPKSSVLTRGFWEDFEELKSTDLQEKLVQEGIIKLLVTILSLKSTHDIDYDQCFDDMGLDSLMMIEFKNGIQRMVRDKGSVSVEMISDANTITQLAVALIEILVKSS